MALKVLSLNIWNFDGPWEMRAKLIRAWIERLDPDVIGFQEVLVGPGLDQARELVPDDYVVEWANCLEFWDDETLGFGNAIASRWPITDREVAELPGAEDGERRVALSLTIDAPFGPLSFTCTHLNHRLYHGWVREKQVIALGDLLRRRCPENGFPPVLVGDMNAEPASTEMRYLTGLHSLDGQSTYLRDAWLLAGDGGPGFTWSNDNSYARLTLEPNRRIDYVFVGVPRDDGLGVIERCRVVCDEAVDGVWPSDHFGLFAELCTEPKA